MTQVPIDVSIIKLTNIDYSCDFRSMFVRLWTVILQVNHVFCVCLSRDHNSLLYKEAYSLKIANRPSQLTSTSDIEAASILSLIAIKTFPPHDILLFKRTE